MLMRQTLDIRGKTAGQVTEEMAKLGARLLVEWLDSPTPPEPQPIAGATYAPEDRQGRGAASTGAGRRQRSNGRFAPLSPPRAPGSTPMASGSSCSRRKSGLRRAAGHAGRGRWTTTLTIAVPSDGYIRPLKVQRAGRGAMSADELLRGFAIPKGTILRDPLAAHDRI